MSTPKIKELQLSAKYCYLWTSTLLSQPCMTLSITTSAASKTLLGDIILIFHDTDTKKKKKANKTANYRDPIKFWGWYPYGFSEGSRWTVDPVLPHCPALFALELTTLKVWALSLEGLPSPSLQQWSFWLKAELMAKALILLWYPWGVWDLCSSATHHSSFLPSNHKSSAEKADRMGKAKSWTGAQH